MINSNSIPKILIVNSFYTALFKEFIFFFNLLCIKYGSPVYNKNWRMTFFPIHTCKIYKYLRVLSLFVENSHPHYFIDI